MALVLATTILTITVSYSALTPATNGTLKELYDASFTGSGTHYVSTVSFINDWGSIGMENTNFNGVVYQRMYYLYFKLYTNILYTYIFN